MFGELYKKQIASAVQRQLNWTHLKDKPYRALEIARMNHVEKE
jgi:hypothetical protein